MLERPSLHIGDRLEVIAVPADPREPGAVVKSADGHLWFALSSVPHDPQGGGEMAHLRAGEFVQVLDVISATSAYARVVGRGTATPPHTTGRVHPEGDAAEERATTSTPSQWYWLTPFDQLHLILEHIGLEHVAGGPGDVSET
jgi:hypothetical protein